jgi:hypothetical protein
MKFINQRQCPRIDIRLRCRVTSPGLCVQAVMYTENISRNGLLVVWDAGPPPEVGRLVTVEVELPAHHGFGRKCIHCQAVVVRTAAAGGELPRVGLGVNQMKFRTYQENISVLQQLEMAEAGGWLA